MFNSKFNDPAFRALTNLMVNEFNNFENSKKYSEFIEPDTDIFESEEVYKISVSIPGIPPNSIEIDVNEQLMSIKAWGKFEDLESNKNNQKKEREEETCNSDTEFKFLSSEIFEGNYFKEVEFPKPIENENIETKLENGILLIIVKKIK